MLRLELTTGSLEYPAAFLTVEGMTSSLGHIVGGLPRVFLTLMALTAVHSPLLSKTPRSRSPEPRLPLTVFVYNLAHVSSAILGRAEVEAARILAEAGVDVTWSHCTLSPAEASGAPVCPASWRPADLILRIVAAPAPGMTREALGFALLGSESVVHALVAYGRVKELAAGGKADLSTILGVAVAHEVGHLLLGSAKHTPTGLMAGHWSDNDLRLAKFQLLRFTPQAAAAIRREVARRQKRQEATSVPGVSSVD